MALPYNGTISIGAVNTELQGGSTNKSLVNLSQQAGKTSPHGLQEFYGYTNKKVTFSSYYSGGAGSWSGTVTIVGGTVNFSAGALLYSAGSLTTSINVNGNTRSINRNTVGQSYSTSFQLGPGTYSYTLTVSIFSGGGSGSINTSWA
jgi:hypothetical protein